ncbi:MAG: DHH family phosphoesterase [Candidatus Nealsonbacteria bacterium]|nr:DHH family phosphoesterase [Candidatus Nealsonbacteria bacterium]
MIEEANNVLLAIPEGPDGDSVGSVWAFLRFLKDKGKNVSLFSPDKIPEENAIFGIFPKVETSFNELPQDAPDLTVIFDYGNAERTKLPKAYVKKMLGFDHHRQSTVGNYPGVSIVDEKKSSTTALLLRFFQAAGYKVDREVATYLMVGLYTDTGGFTNALINPEGFSIAGELLALGADIEKIKIYASGVRIDKRQIRVLKYAYQKLVIFSNLAYLTFSRKEFEKLNAQQRDLGKIMGLIKNAEDLEVFALITEDNEGKWRCSMRRCPKNDIDLAELAAKFGGGGHTGAAAFVFDGKEKDLLSKLILEVVISREKKGVGATNA